MATIRKRKTSKGKVRYQAVVVREGYPTKRATFPTEREAERWAKIVEGDYARGKHLPSLEAERHTVDELLDRFEKDMTEARRKATTSHIKFWRTEIGDKKLSEVTAALLREKRDKLAKEPYTRSAVRKEVTLTRRRMAKEPKTYNRAPASVNRYMETISRALSVAESEYEWVPENVASKIADLAESQGRVRFLTVDERKVLLRACRDQGEDLYALVVTALCTGARAGELLDLTWKDVDLDRRVAILNRTKNKERRSLTLAGPAYDVLEARKKIRRIDTDRVFPHPVTTGRQDYAKPFKAALRTAGINDFRFHDLRHTTASYLAMNGASTAEIAAVLGHKTLQMVKRYAHLSDQHVANVVERMNTAVFGRG